MYLSVVIEFLVLICLLNSFTLAQICTKQIRRSQMVTTQRDGKNVTQVKHKGHKDINLQHARTKFNLFTDLPIDTLCSQNDKGLLHRLQTKQ